MTEDSCANDSSDDSSCDASCHELSITLVVLTHGSFRGYIRSVRARLESKVSHSRGTKEEGD